MSIRFVAIAASICAGMFAQLTVAADSTDSHFIKDAIEGNLAEVKIGNLAQQQGASQGVKDFGDTLAKDHGSANTQAQQVAQKLGVSPPEEPGLKQKAMYKELSAMKGDSFDRHFVNAMIKDHKEDIAKYEKEANSGSGPTAGYAKQVLPDLKKHLEIAERLQKEERTAEASGHKKTG